MSPSQSQTYHQKELLTNANEEQGSSKPSQRIKKLQNKLSNIDTGSGAKYATQIKKKSNSKMANFDISPVVVDAKSPSKLTKAPRSKTGAQT